MSVEVLTGRICFLAYAVFDKSKKGSRTISRVMSPRDFYAWIRRSGRLPRRPCHLSNRCLALLRHSSSLPPGYGRAAHCDTSRLRKLFCHAPVYMALQPIRRAACHVAMTPGGLLPHLFTIACFPGPCGTELLAGCYFLSRYSAVTDSSLLESMVLCVARTFLLPLRSSPPSASDTSVLLPLQSYE